MALFLAFDHHCKQHVGPDEYYPVSFSNQHKSVARKIHLSESFGVRLVVVPHFICCVLLNSSLLVAHF